MIPPLTTPRLRMTPFRAEDAPDLHRLWAEPDVRRFLWDDRIIPIELAEAVVREAVAEAGRSGIGMWALRPLDAGACIGFCGFRPIAGAGEVELLYGLSRPWWGRGLATEAARRALGYLFTAVAPGRVLAGADPPNLASIRVLGRLGMAPLPGGLPSAPGVPYDQVRREDVPIGPGRAT